MSIAQQLLRISFPILLSIHAHEQPLCISFLISKNWLVHPIMELFKLQQEVVRLLQTFMDLLTLRLLSKLISLKLLMMRLQILSNFNCLHPSSSVGIYLLNVFLYYRNVYAASLSAKQAHGSKLVIDYNISLWLNKCYMLLDNDQYL